MERIEKKTIQAYPLKWPQGWPRTGKPERARFENYSLAYVRGHLIAELNRLGARDIIISSDIPLRLDGLPRSSYRRLDDEGVTVYFKLDKIDQCLPCDRWNNIIHNIWAITKSIEALRGLSRWGAKDIVKTAFTGFRALPFHAELEDFGGTTENYFRYCKNLDDIKDVFKQKANLLHPDYGGNILDFQELKKQRDEAKKRFQS